MRALVVGADGFAGRWLVRHLRDAGDEVVGVVGPRYRPPLEGAVHVVGADVRAYEPLAEAVAAANPDALYFLAAVSQVGGREQVADAARIGLVGAIHALTACAELDHHVRVLHVSSAHVYGPAGASPITEDGPVRPTSVYGAAKAASEQALLALGPAVGVDVIVARPFNHIGPGQAPSFLVPSLAAQVRDIPPAGRGTLRVGKPDVVRDFTDVRDVVRAYRILVTDGEPATVYNVASGVGRSAHDVIELLADIAGVSIDLQVEPSIAREGEPATLIGSSQRLQGLGWSPERELRETLADVLAADA